MSRRVYRLVFSSNDIKNFRKNLSKILLKMAAYDEEEEAGIATEERLKISEFKIEYENEKIVIWLPKTPEAFTFLAEILDNMNDFKIAYNSLISAPDDISEINVNFHKTAEELDYGLSRYIKNKHIYGIVKRRIDKDTKAAIVMRYILSIEGKFTFNDINEHFEGKISGATIRNAIKSLHCVGNAYRVGQIDVFYLREIE